MVGNMEYISGNAHLADESVTLSRFAAHVFLCTLSYSIWDLFAVLWEPHLLPYSVKRHRL
jgi:hypothetical protein